jgi:hypothetical protein
VCVCVYICYKSANMYARIYTLHIMYIMYIYIHTHTHTHTHTQTSQGEREEAGRGATK